MFQLLYENKPLKNTETIFKQEAFEKYCNHFLTRSLL